MLKGQYRESFHFEVFRQSNLLGTPKKDKKNLFWFLFLIVPWKIPHHTQFFSILVKLDEKSLVKNLVAMFLKSAWMMSIGSMKTTVYCTNQLPTKLLHSLDENSKCAVNPLKTCVLNVKTTIKLFSTKAFFHRWNS